jgi:predicted TIM-barrel fold metal-dependent hydrolase
VPEGIRDLAEIYGADRLIYGSGFPTFDYGSSMLQLKHSGLPDEEVQKIAGKNLLNLLKGSEL